MTAVIFSSKQQLEKLAKIIQCCCRLPMSGDNVPGATLEAVLANARGGKMLSTYDYIDVLHEEGKLGWSIKSTKESTPMTWKRGKIPDKASMIKASHASSNGIQQLGDALIRFCNDHAKASMEKYDLTAIGYSRLIVHKDRTATYFERLLCTKNSPDIFDPRDFEWKWSEEKSKGKKEQLSALHGWHRATGKRWWAWHGLGENQLHFTGESGWWPSSEDQHAIRFELPESADKLTFERLVALLDAA